MAKQKPFSWRKNTLLHSQWPEEKRAQIVPQGARAKNLSCCMLGCLCRNDIVKVQNKLNLA